MSPFARWISRQRLVLRLLTVTHVAVYTWSGGRLGARGRGLDFLLLHTTGARTGRPRTAPLLYLDDRAGPGASGALVVVGSNGGRANHPAWVHNLRKAPLAAVTVGRERRPVEARFAAAAERERLWPLLDRLYPYDAYRAQTSREIAIVLLRPV